MTNNSVKIQEIQHIRPHTMKVIRYLKGIGNLCCLYLIIYIKQKKKIKTIIIIIPFIAVPKNIVIFFILTVGTVKLGL